MKCRFSRFHPITAAVYYLAILTVAVFFVNPIFTAVTFVSGLFFDAVINGVRELLGKIGFYLLVIFTVSIANPIFSHNGATPLFFLNGKPVTLESCLYGVNMAFAVVGVLCWCGTLTKIMTDDKVLYLFSRFAPRIGLVLSMAIRFVPMLKDEYKKICNAQKTMGMFSSESIFDRVLSAVKAFSVLITWSFENSIDTANSMKGRGYGTGKRTCFSIFKFKKSDVVFLLITLTGFAVLAVMLSYGAADFYFYPKITSFSNSAWAVYVIYGGLAFLPFSVELRERIVWSVLRSKI